MTNQSVCGKVRDKHIVTSTPAIISMKWWSDSHQIWYKSRI